MNEASRNVEWLLPWVWVGLCACVAAATGCDGAAAGRGGTHSTIRVEGSDTMVNVAQAWAEEYHQREPDISV